jgi:histidinol-phosphate aminotransferase
VLVDFARDAAPIERALLERGVIARPMGGYGLHECLRISVGLHSENERLLTAIEAASLADTAA